MLSSRTRWNLRHVDTEQAERLAAQSGIHPLVARLLLARGYDTEEQVRSFLQTGSDMLHDPFLMDGMREAVETIRKAVDSGTYIRIYGDYDVDGISSTSLMFRLFRALGARFDYYIPHRVQEGYGLNKSALDKAKEDGVELIVTVDTGISAYEEAQYAAELGIGMVITDHHEPPEQLPEAIAVINPKKPACNYPYKHLAGVGVAFKLAHALSESVPEQLAELAALGTIADLMPLTDENRALVSLGLQQMQRTSNVGLRALFEEAGLSGKPITAGHIGFAIAPRINAGGRLTSADSAVQLLTTDDEAEAAQLARELDELNRERQRIVDETVEEALVQLSDTYGERLPPVIIVASENWNAGVIGIAAARLLERFYRPTLVFTVDPATGLAKGSARSIAGYDMYRALTAASDLLDHYGGHQAAAGLTLAADQLSELQRRLNNLAADWLSEDDYIASLDADLGCSLSDCTVDLIEQLELLAPYGIGNSTPKLMLERCAIQDIRKIGRTGQHLKLTLTDGSESEGGSVLDAVGFNLGELHMHISPHARIDVVGELQVNEWNGQRKPQLLIKDARVAQLQVFDWRGLKPDRNGGGKQRAYPGLRDETQFVICDGAEFWEETIAAMFGERTILLIDDAGKLRSATGARLGPEDIQPLTDLVLVQLPLSEQALSQLLATYGSSLQRICIWFADAEELATGCPPRERFKHVYSYAKRQQRWRITDDGLLRAWSSRAGLSTQDVAFIIRVFEDLGFVEQAEGEYRFVTNPAPRDLAESRSFAERSSGQPLAEQFMLLSSGQLTSMIAHTVREAVAETG